MNRNPVVRLAHWPSFFLQLLIILAVFLAIHILLPVASVDQKLMLAAFAYIAFCRLMRALFIKDYTKAVKAYHQSRFEDAARYFAASHEFFVKHPNIDRWRWLIFGVTSPYSYRVLCLGNQAVCYTQLGQAKKAIALYEEALREEPNYRLAKFSLDGLRAVLREAGGQSATA